MQSVRNKNLLTYHFIVLLFGLTSVLGALISISALHIVIYRMSLATLGLGVFFLLFNPNYFKLKKSLWWKVFLGGLLIGFHWITFFYAIKIAGIHLTLSMMSTGAFITAILDPIFNNRKLLFHELLFGSIIALGIWVIYQSEFEHLYGILIAFFSALLSSIFTIINGNMVRHAQPITLSFYELLVGSVICVLVAYFTNQLNIVHFELSSWDFLWILILSFLCTSYAFNMSIRVMKYLSSYTIMMVINLEPIYGTLISFFIWEEKSLLSLNFYFGFLIVILAICMNGIFKYKKDILK